MCSNSCRVYVKKSSTRAGGTLNFRNYWLENISIIEKISILVSFQSSTSADAVNGLQTEHAINLLGSRDMKTVISSKNFLPAALGMNFTPTGVFQFVL